MNVHLCVRNDSQRKRLYRTDALRRLAERICAGEDVETDIELSVLLCDDASMRELNRTYRDKDRPTDVLAFAQTPADRGKHPAGEGPMVLGDIVISLETVARHCADAPQTRGAMRQEVHLLFCHGLLHLLGVDHATAAAREAMNAKQARYLGTTTEAAWRTPPRTSRGRRKKARTG